VNPQYPHVSARARHACEYRRAPEVVFNLPFEVEHVTPLSRGGETNTKNLALACRSCNLFKSNRVSALDELTGQEVALFNPRLGAWRDHFSLTEETGEITGLPPIGRATVALLRFNSRAQIEARRQWLRLGLLSLS
jgi:hypothetical protein